MQGSGIFTTPHLDGASVPPAAQRSGRGQAIRPVEDPACGGGDKMDTSSHTKVTKEKFYVFPFVSSLALPAH
jgi:hypothetical protein